MDADLRDVIQEFGRLLDQLGAELAASVQEADREYRCVGLAFRALGEANRRNAQIRVGVPAAPALRANCAAIDVALQQAVVALQYQDRLAQRLGHVRAGLDGLQDKLRDGAARSYGEWLEVLREVERAHSSEQRRLRTVEAAANGSVELF